jgi:hypothetical protein
MQLRHAPGRGLVLNGYSIDRPAADSPINRQIETHTHTGSSEGEEYSDSS